MQDLKKHEAFEMEVLEILSKNSLLTPLIFGGGTCLRLCYGLDRYSVDLDFWVRKDVPATYFPKIRKVLSRHYEITDHHEKHFSYLTEIKKEGYNRRLKLEIRKELDPPKETELVIAFSSQSDKQVRLIAFALKQMFLNKVVALLSRKEIRDAYDLEFMLKKDKSLIKELPKEDRVELKNIVSAFSKKDFLVKLGSLLESSERKYYNENGFEILKRFL